VEYALALLILIVAVAVLVTAPLRRDEVASDAAAADRRAELEAAKEAKYREIRDAELDFRMGKVSEADHRATDRELRAQAIAILERIDELDAQAPAPSAPAGDRAQARESG
jgi:Sec-independent protein translocase protein TatA